VASLTQTPPTREAIEAFRRDVVEASLTQVVLLRFTADWCGPCKQLAPLIDKVVADSGNGRVKQVVVDIDRQGWIAEQFRVQSVPTVYALVGGQPVDGFVGAKTERELKAFIEKLTAQLPPTDEEADLDTIIAEAESQLAAGAAEQAAEIFAAVTREAPDRLDAIAGYARALLALGHIEGAAAALAAVPADSKDAAIVQARAALDLAQNAAPAGELAALNQAVAANPADHDARLALANALFAGGDRDAAADHLLHSIALDREWNEGAARAQLLKFVDAVGFADPWSAAIRRRLSAIIFT